MPLFVGAATGLLAPLVWGRGCGAPAVRRVLTVGLSAWAVHLALVGGGLVREGSLLDYVCVLLVSAAAGALSCGRVQKSS